MAMKDWANAIASIESAGSGGYSALGPVTKRGNRAYGKYQVMDFNIGPWTEKYVGRRMTPDEFLASPEAQDAVFAGEFGGNVEKYGSPQEAASVWFTGQPMSRGANRKDMLGTTGSGYVSKFNRALGNLQGNYATPTISTKGGQAVNPDEIAQDATAQSTGGGILGMLGGQQQERPPLRERFRDPNFWNEVALTFHSMSSFPNEQAIRSLESRVERGREIAQLNKTADWLQSEGQGSLADGVRTGAIPASVGLNMYQRAKVAASSPNVQSSQMLRDMSGTILTMRDGSIKVLTSGGEELSGQAAMDFIKKAEENYYSGQRSLYGAREEGKLGAQIEKGGAAKAAETAGGEMTKRAFDAYDKAMLANQSISTINEAISAIDNGAESGLVYNMLPNVTEASASLNNAMNRMGLDVISSVTFGALSEGEMKLAMETAVPRNLNPTELRSWLVKKADAQAKARDALVAAARYLSTPGNTLNGWLEQQEKSGQQKSGETKVRTYNPETGKLE